MAERVRILFLGSAKDSAQLAQTLAEQGLDARVDAADGPNDFGLQLTDAAGRWDLVLAGARAFIRYRIGDMLASHADEVDASVVLLKSPTDKIAPHVAYAHGAHDLVVLSDIAHLLMVIRREMENVRTRRALRHARRSASSVRAVLRPSTPVRPVAGGNARRSAPDVILLLKNAIAGNSLALQFQPIISLTGTERLAMFEVFSRLQADDGEFIYPGTFIPAAERYGVMERLDRVVIEKALAMLSNLQRDHRVCFFINVAGRSLRGDGMSEFLESKLDAAHLMHSSVTFEVGRNTPSETLTEIAELKHRLRRFGLRFLLETFGDLDCAEPGLDDARIDYVKFSPALIADLARNPQKREYVSQLVQCAKKKKIRVIAHTVEKAEWLPFLYSLGIDYVQGNFVSVPCDQPVSPEIAKVEVTDRASQSRWWG